LDEEIPSLKRYIAFPAYNNMKRYFVYLHFFRSHCTDSQCLKLGAVKTVLKPLCLDVIFDLIANLNLKLLNENDEKPTPLSLRLREILQSTSLDLTPEMEDTLIESIAVLKALGN
jgi:hypothetical protein